MRVGRRFRSSPPLAKAIPQCRVSGPRHFLGHITLELRLRGRPEGHGAFPSEGNPRDSPFAFPLDSTVLAVISPSHGGSEDEGEIQGSLYAGGRRCHSCLPTWRVLQTRPGSSTVDTQGRSALQIIWSGRAFVESVPVYHP